MSDDQTNRILQAIAGLHSEIQTLRSDLAALDAKVTALESKVTAELTALDAKVTAFRAETMDRIDRLQDQLTARREGDVVVFDAAERAEKVAISTREEVHSISHQLNSLTRLVKMLQNRMDDFENRNGPAPS